MGEHKGSVHTRLPFQAAPNTCKKWQPTTETNSMGARSRSWCLCICTKYARFCETGSAVQPPNSFFISKFMRLHCCPFMLTCSVKSLLYCGAASSSNEGKMSLTASLNAATRLSSRGKTCIHPHHQLRCHCARTGVHCYPPPSPCGQ